MQKWFNIYTSIHIIPLTGQKKDKINMVISMDAWKAFNKIQHLIIIKTLNKVDIKRTYLNIIEAISNPQLKLYSIVKS